MELGPNDRAEWCGFTIKRKQDMKNWETTEGYVVVEKGCNAMPGATWFRTTAQAKQGIAALCLARKIAPSDGGDRCDRDVFWWLMELTRKQ
jgi:hypothetical protein